MATTDHKALGSALRAQIDERFFAPLRRNTFATRTWFVVTVTIVLVLHGVLLAAFLYRDAKQRAEEAQQQETPVEVVVEQPPAPKPPPPPPPKPQPQKQEIEKPATSAPRAESDTKIDTEKLDPDTHAPKAAAPPQDGQPSPAPDSAAPDKAVADRDDADAAPNKPDVLKKDAEALDKAAPEPKKEEPKPAKAKVAAHTKRPKTALQQMAGLSDLPDYHFARKTKKSPVSGGSEDSRYLAIVYGLIMQRVRGGGEGSVSVAFELDSDGSVVAIELTRPSGDPLADSAVINAVRQASPFPPPPPDRPHSLTATIDFARHPMSMGAQ